MARWRETRTLRFVALVGTVALLLAACSGGDDDTAKKSDNGGGSRKPSLTKVEKDPRAASLTEGSDVTAFQASGSAADPRGQGGGGGGTEFRELIDGTKTAVLTVPTAWTDLSNWVFVNTDNTTFGAGLAASTSIAAYKENWGVPFAAFVATNNPTHALMTGDFNAVLQSNGFPNDCTDDGIENYADHGYTGLIQTWSGCGTSDTQWTVVAVKADDGSHGGLVMTALPPADVSARDTILGSFKVTGTLTS